MTRIITVGTGSVIVGITVGSVQSRAIVQPGLQTRVPVVALIDDVQRMIEVDVTVFSPPCPDPTAHMGACAETRHDQLGDCNGDERLYAVAGADLLGVPEGGEIVLCASHAQVNGRHIRRIR